MIYPCFDHHHQVRARRAILLFSVFSSIYFLVPPMQQIKTFFSQLYVIRDLTNRGVVRNKGREDMYKNDVRKKVPLDHTWNRIIL